jgi:porin
MKNILSRTQLSAIVLIAVTFAPSSEAGDPGAPSGAAAGSEATLYPIPDYEGDLCARPALTGDWGGTRTSIAQRGVQFKFDATQYYQGIADGGMPDNGDWEYNGIANYRLLLDTGKAGFWPGGFFEVHGQSYWGKPVNSSVGAVAGVNFQPSLKAAASTDNTYLPHVTFTQFLSESFAITIGKQNTAVGDTNDFAHGEGDTMFMNAAFNLNPTTYLSSPYSTLGAGFIYLFGENKENMFAMLVYDGDGSVDESGFDTVFHDRTTVGANLRLRTNFLGKKGHQYFGAIYGFGDYPEQGFSPIDSLPPSVPLPPGAESPQADGTWTLFYNFDQMLVANPNDPEQGWGVFGRFGIADDKSSAIHTFTSLGLGGTGLIPGRDRDRFGLGVYYMTFADERVKLILSEDKEYGMELYYTMEVTPWFQCTADLQVVEGAILGADTAVIGAVRGRVSF